MNKLTITQERFVPKVNIVNGGVTMVKCLQKIRYRKNNFYIYCGDYKKIKAIKKYYKGNYYIFLKNDLRTDTKRTLINKLLSSKIKNIKIITCI